MDPNVFRRFWIDVVGVDKPKLVKTAAPRRADDVQGIDQEAEAAQEQADAAELQARAAADKAQIMKRLEALVGPYKEAVAENGPVAKRLQALFGTIKTSLARRQFSQTAEALDTLEDLLDKQTIPPPGVDDDDNDEPSSEHDISFDDDDNVPSRKQRVGADDEERIRDVPATRDSTDSEKEESYEYRVLIKNNTDVELKLRAEELDRATYVNPPAEAIAPGQHDEFVVRDKGVHYFFGGATWDLEGPFGGKWSIQYYYDLTDHGVDCKTFSSITSEHYVAGKHECNGKNLEFNLDPKGAPPPPPGQFVSKVDVQNDTDVALNNTSQMKPAVGTFVTKPPNAIPAHSKAEFTIQSGKDPMSGKEAIDAAVIWEPEGAQQGEQWTIGFNRWSKDDPGKGVQNLTSSRFAADEPVVNGNDFRFALNGAPPPPPDQFLSQVVVQNNTDVALNNTGQMNPAVGTFVTKPPNAIPAHSKAVFTIQSGKDPMSGKDAINAAVTWEPEGAQQGELWSIGFNRWSKDDPGKGVQNLISGRFAADEPVVNGNDFRFALNAAPDAEYKPPKPEKQPTVKIGDNSLDGWVEYLQEQLNEQLKDYDNPNGFKYTLDLPLDGKFDFNVDQAVRALQTKAKILVDGIVGNQTWAALRHGTPEKPGVRGHKLDVGFKARWLTEDEVCTYVSGSDSLLLKLVSVGTADLKGAKAYIFVYLQGADPPLGKPPAGRGKPWIIGAPIDPTPTKTGEGNVHQVEVPDFKKAYGLPDGVDVRNCRIEAYFDQDMGGDRWFYHPGRGQIAVN